MNIGDLVRYRVIKDLRPDLGIVVDILDERDRPGGDNVLVQWPSGKRWCVEPKWVDVVACGVCNKRRRVV